MIQARLNNTHTEREVKFKHLCVGPVEGIITKGFHTDYTERMEELLCPLFADLEPGWIDKGFQLFNRMSVISTGISAAVIH
jgi:hypothetical protein